MGLWVKGLPVCDRGGTGLGDGVLDSKSKFGETSSDEDGKNKIENRKIV